MEKQRERARQAHKSVDILVSEGSEDGNATEFVGYELENLQNFPPNALI